MPSATAFAGSGFGGLPNLIVVSIVLAGATLLTGNGFRSLSNLFVVLAGAAILAGNGFRRLPNLVVVSIVLAGAAIVATGYVIIHSRSILSTWASFAGGCFRKWFKVGFAMKVPGEQHPKRPVDVK